MRIQSDRTAVRTWVLDGANQAPVAEHLRREFAAEIERARQEDDQLLGQSGGSDELADVHCDDCGGAIRAEETRLLGLYLRRLRAMLLFQIARRG